MKKLILILIIVFIAGILSADVCLTQLKESAVVVNKDLYEQYANAKLAFKDVFWNLMYERLKLFIVLIILYFTPLKDYIGKIILPMFSFLWGFFLMTCIVELGIAGLVVGLACVVPHGLLYGVALGLLSSRRHVRSYHIKNQLAINVGVYLFLFLLFLAACIIESLIGTHFIPWIIRLGLV